MKDKLKVIEDAVAEYRAANAKRQQFVDEWMMAQKATDAAREKMIKVLGLSSNIKNDGSQTATATSRPF